MSKKDTLLSPKFNVTLGDMDDPRNQEVCRRYTVKDLPIRACEEWSEGVMKLFTDMEGVDPTDSSALEAVFKKAPAGFIELCFEYSEPLHNDRQWIENNATPVQMFELTKKIMERALPFLLRMNELTPVG